MNFCIEAAVEGAGGEEALEPGLELAIVFHEPEVSLFGRAVVRHCTEFEHGSFFVGIQFLFEGE